MVDSKSSGSNKKKRKKGSPSAGGGGGTETEKEKEKRTKTGRACDACVSQSRVERQTDREGVAANVNEGKGADFPEDQENQM
jgi:hypothetical protein